MFKNAKPYPLLFFAIAFAGQALAAGDPTLSEVYQAARAGRVTQAQQMMQQVLRDHPGSSKAHYVAAELYARRGDRATARQELNTAEALQPGLPFVNAASIQALRKALSQARPAHTLPKSQPARSSDLWGALIWIVAGVGVLWLALHRRISHCD